MKGSLISSNFSLVAYPFDSRTSNTVVFIGRLANRYGCEYMRLLSIPSRYDYT